MAAGKYKFHDGEKIRLTRAAIATATAIEAGDLVAIDSGLIIKAVAASTAVAFCPDGHAANSGTSVEVTVGNDFTLKGTSDAAFAITDKGVACGIDDTTQYIDLSDTSGTDVLKVSIAEDAGVVGSTEDVVVRINVPLF
ncbi:hypothetical protein HGB07_05935 [Candidatus Roizmanbacteria bacterium]|nr:hypothetical protein [Candidatus Roizmanbacteria bacterium]